MTGKSNEERSFFKRYRLLNRHYKSNG